MRGSSGATIVVRSDYVTKSFPGNSRLYQQALYLERNDNPLLPDVYQIRRDYYTMELLSEPPYQLLDHNAVLTLMIAGLSFHVWSLPAETSFSAASLYDKINDLTDRENLVHLRETIFTLGNTIAWDDLKKCLTHGDATFDNVMIRPSTGELVLIDPIPATTSLGAADLRSSDFGHILRSCFGFELARYGEEYLRFRVTPEHLKLYVGDDNEWRATVFWCIVHFLRVLPYMPKDCYDQMRNIILEVVNYARETFGIV